MSAAHPRECPVCGGVNPAVPRDELTEDERYCTPLPCSAWTFTHRLEARVSAADRRGFYATAIYPYPSPFAAEPRPSERELKQLRKLLDEAKVVLGEWAYRATTRPRVW